MDQETVDKIEAANKVVEGIPGPTPEVRISKIFLPNQVDDMATITFEIEYKPGSAGSDMVVEVPIEVQYVGTASSAIRAAGIIFRERIATFTLLPETRIVKH